MNQKGMTFVELIIVIVILSIISAVAIPTFGTLVESSQENATLKEMREIQIAIVGNEDFRGYLQDVGSLPANLTDLTAGPSGYDPFTQSGRRGNYLSSADNDGNGIADILEDAWGTQYDWTSGTGLLRSFGPDATDDSGGDDDIDLDVDG